MAALLLFGISFGYAEAAVVVYFQSIYASPRAFAANQPPIDPRILVSQLTSGMPRDNWLLKTEVIREGATMIMLAAVALAAASTIQQWLSAFLIAFGAWDISFYLWLKFLIHWPQSVFTWDVLFLLPVPWLGPVLAPVLVSLSMLAAGTMLLWRDHNGYTLRLASPQWAAMLAGGLILVLSFTLDFRSFLAGRQPNTFRWPLFGLGEAVGISGFLGAAAAGGRTARHYLGAHSDHPDSTLQS